MKRLGFFILTVLAGPVLAMAPDMSLRPVERAGVRTVVQVPVVTTSARPKMRPRGGLSATLVAPAQRHPSVRPEATEQKAVSKRRARRKGAVCGHLEIKGTEMGSVPGTLKGCGLNNAVRVTSISGVRLSRPSTMDCSTAKALNKWVDKAVIPAFRRRGKVVELKIAAHYSCRTRNNKPGARISEHGRGKAIDISGFTMKSGKVITVAGNWGKGKPGKALAEVHKKACGPFGTVLGPRADRHHQDHFHLDTASYRGGPYCK